MDACWIVADAHLDGSRSGTAEMFSAFTEKFRRSGCPRLVVLGDLFTSWIGMDGALTDFQRSVLGVVGTARGEGKETVLIPGNRDYFAEELKDSPFTLVAERLDMVLPSGKKARFEHGEKINRLDRNYLAWSGFSRTNAVKALAGTLPAAALQSLAAALERKLAETNLDYKAELPEGELRRYAREASEENVALLVLGHFHRGETITEAGVVVEVLDRFEPGGSYAVLGDDGRITRASL